MTRSQRVISSPHSLPHRPSTSSGVTTQSEDPQSRVIVERVGCSGLKPPRYPGGPSRLGQNQYIPKQRSTTRRRRKASSAGGVGRSGTQRARVPREAVVRQGRRADSEGIPSRPLQRTHARSANQNGRPAKRMNAGSAIKTLKRAGVYEAVREQGERREARAAQERERQRYPEQDISRRLSVSKSETELREMQKREIEKDAKDFARSGVYTREQHQRPRYWIAGRIWKDIGGFAELVATRKPRFGVRDRLQLSTTGTSCR